MSSNIERILYSAPFALVGKTLWLRATDGSVALFEDYRHVTTHPRGQRAGQRITCKDHLPPQAQAFFAKDRQWCTTQATEVGPHCVALIEQLLSENILERLRAAQGLLGLLKTYGAARLEAACQRALAHDSPHYRTIKTILKSRADLHGQSDSSVTPAAELFPNPQHHLLH